MAEPVEIPRASDEEIAMTNITGNALRCGHQFGVWEKDIHPYGRPAPCPFCKEPLEYTELFYNGSGPPPSYAICCGYCGAQGPSSRGNGRGDHYGARLDAVRLWNAALTQGEEK